MARRAPGGIFPLATSTAMARETSAMRRSRFRTPASRV